MKNESKSYNYMRALIIVNGKSKKKICQYVIQNLRLNIKIKEDKQEFKSTKFNGIMNVFNDNQHKTVDAFYSSYKGIEIEGKGPIKKIKNFKIFVILDLDECSEEEKQQYLNKTMFKNHWMYEYIIPIFNEKNLEEVLIDCKVPYEKKEFKDSKKDYLHVFPIKNKFKQKKTDRAEIQEFRNMIKDSKKTNLKELLDYCTSINANI